MSKGLQKVRIAEFKSILARRFIAALVGGLVTLDAGFVAAESVRTLTGGQLRAAFTGKQLTDEVHYRFVYDSDGTLRTYSMGAKQVGKWRIQKDEICLYIKNMEDGCYRVTQSGKRFELKPTGLGGSLDGILEPAYHGDGG